MESSDDIAKARRSMVTEQLERRGITTPRVLAAMAKLPRDRFVPDVAPVEAYADRAWPIDCGQTISQPYIVGLMTQAAALEGTEHVLEVGTGSSYQAAILAMLARSVVSIERHPQLSAQAGRLLAGLGIMNVKLVVGDGTLGWREDAPYDRILVTATAADCPPALWEQLAEGGTLVMPLGDSNKQTLQSLRKVQGRAVRTTLSGCRFVPLVGAQGWPEEGPG